MDTFLSTEVQPHVYPPAARLSILAVAGVLVAIGLCALAIPRAAFSTLVFGGAGGLVAYATARKRLVVAARGLEYRDWLGTTAVTWNEVIGIVRVSTRFGSHSALALANGRAAISLAEFGGAEWRDSPLGQDLRRWAPRLMPDNDPAPA